MSASMVRPSIAFVSMNRENQKQSIYVDQYDGPSSLQKRDGIPTLKEKANGSPLIYETERERHSRELSKQLNNLKTAQEKLMTDTGILRSPKERRGELLDIKAKLQTFNALKTQHVFFGKRDRIFKGGWRHGIVGVDDGDSPEASVFYKSHQE